MNSQPGGEETTPEELAAGEEAIEAVADRLRDRVASVETHQFVQGNDPVEDLLECAADVGADQFVIGIHSHSPAGKIVFGSTAQSLLLTADRPVLGVPLAEGETVEETPTIFRSH